MNALLCNIMALRATAMKPSQRVHGTGECMRNYLEFSCRLQMCILALQLLPLVTNRAPITSNAQSAK